jgi:hypothetical protein
MDAPVVRTEFVIVQVSPRRYLVARLTFLNQFVWGTGNGYGATWEVKQGDVAFGPARLPECKEFISRTIDPIRKDHDPETRSVREPAIR